jgi:hypothetical protein
VVVFSAWSVQSSYKEVFSSIEKSEAPNFETPACRDMGLKLNRVEFRDVSLLGAEELN